MTNPQLAGLRDDEREALLFDSTRITKGDGLHRKDSRELLAERLSESRASEDRKRELLKKHQWTSNPRFPANYFCPECDSNSVEGHTPDCAIAAELAGTGE